MGSSFLGFFQAPEVSPLKYWSIQYFGVLLLFFHEEEGGNKTEDNFMEAQKEYGVEKGLTHTKSLICKLVENFIRKTQASFQSVNKQSGLICFLKVCHPSCILAKVHNGHNAETNSQLNCSPLLPSVGENTRCLKLQCNNKVPSIFFVVVITN